MGTIQKIQKGSKGAGHAIESLCRHPSQRALATEYESEDLRAHAFEAGPSRSAERSASAGLGTWLLLLI